MLTEPSFFFVFLYMAEAPPPWPFPRKNHDRLNHRVLNFFFFFFSNGSFCTPKQHLNKQLPSNIICATNFNKPPKNKNCFQYHFKNWHSKTMFLQKCCLSILPVMFLQREGAPDRATYNITSLSSSNLCTHFRSRVCYPRTFPSEQLFPCAA